MRKKMAAAVLMAAMTASLLAGCGDSKSSDSTKADSAQTTASNQSEAGDSTSDLKDGKTEELLMVWPGSNASPADMQAVEDAMNEIIGEKVDAKVKLQIIEWGAYNDQTNLMLSSGEKLDMVFLMSNIREDGQRGQLYPINDLVETYAPDAYSAMERYIEACYFDGKVVLPMCKPIIATVGLFAGLGYWNDWTNGLYYITDTNKFSIQQLLNNMIKNIEFLSKNANSNINLASVGGGIPQETVRMAIAIVGLLPILIVFPFVQKYFVKGISIGAVKG